jgi:hypothetical protein
MGKGEVKCRSRNVKLSEPRLELPRDGLGQERIPIYQSQSEEEIITCKSSPRKKEPPPYKSGLRRSMKFKFGHVHDRSDSAFFL